MPLTVSQIIAHAFKDAAAAVVTNVPGYGGTQVFEAYSGITSHRPCLPYFHEEVAYTVAHGSSLMGKRSATLLKAHGLAKAANSVVDSLTAGVNAGFVVMVFDDKQGKHSDSILDVVALLQGLALPYRIPKISDIYREVADSFVRSEDSGLPVALLVDTEDLAYESTYASKPVAPSPRPFRRNPLQHVLCPLLAEYQHQVLSAKQAFKKWESFTAPALPHIPDALPPEWREAVAVYQPFFDAFKQMRGDVVVGDTGVSSLFSFPPYNCIDICTYMGGSVPLALGAQLAGYGNVWALTGDFSFIAAGHLGLLEARQRGVPLKVVIFYNHRALTTGGQLVASGVMEALLKSYEPVLVTIKNPSNTAEVAAALTAVKGIDEMRIVLCDYPHT